MDSISIMESKQIPQINLSWIIILFNILIDKLIAICIAFVKLLRPGIQFMVNFHSITNILPRTYHSTERSECAYQIVT